MSKNEILALILDSVFSNGDATVVEQGSEPLGELINNEGRPRRPVIEIGDELQLETSEVELSPAAEDLRLWRLQEEQGAILL